MRWDGEVSNVRRQEGEEYVAVSRKDVLLLLYLLLAVVDEKKIKKYIVSFGEHFVF